MDGPGRAEMCPARTSLALLFHVVDARLLSSILGGPTPSIDTHFLLRGGHPSLDDDDGLDGGNHSQGGDSRLVGGGKDEFAASGAFILLHPYLT